MPRLWLFEAEAQGWTEPVAKAKHLEGVERSLGRSLLHLHPTGAALGRSEFDIGVSQAVEEASASGGMF